MHNERLRFTTSRLRVLVAVVLEFGTVLMFLAHSSCSVPKSSGVDRIAQRVQA